jgi:hypothetical protein
VPKLSVKILDSVKVLLKRVREIITTDKPSILKLVIEDVPLETRASSPAESSEDQTKMTKVLTHGSVAQESHGRDNHSEELVKNSPCLDQAQVGSGERDQMANGCH